MRVLVTGGAGFIGSHVVDALLNRGYEVSVLDNLLPPVHREKRKPGYLPPDVEFIEGDVRDKRAVAKALKGVNLLFHKAAYQGFLPDFSNYFHTNTVGTALLIEVIVEEKLPVEKIIFASSQAVYGEGRYSCPEHGDFFPDPRPLSRLMCHKWEILCPVCGGFCLARPVTEDKVNPHTQYAMSKYKQEMIAINLGKRHGIPAVGLRYSIIQGPRQSFYNAYSGILRIFTARLLNGKPPVIYEDGLMLRDYTHIRDAVSANMFVLSDERSNFQVYNVGGGKPCTVLHFAEKLKEYLGVSIDPVIPGEFRLGDARHIFSDTSKLKGLGWSPKCSLDDIIKDYVGWVCEQGEVIDHFAKAEKKLKATGAVRSGSKQ